MYPIKSGHDPIVAVQMLYRMLSCEYIGLRLVCVVAE